MLDTLLCTLTYTPEPILVMGLGTSPAIITETVYGLMVTPEKQLPLRIVVITTTTGRDKLIDSQFFTLQSPLIAMCDEYGIARIPFSLDDVKLISDINNPDSEPLQDIITGDDNSILADFITAELYALTSAEVSTEMISTPLIYTDIHSGQPSQAFKDTLAQLYNVKAIRFNKKKDGFKIIYHKYVICASVTGGRKTMTFLFGYIMTLLGRENDSLTHVLLPNWLSNADFYYPRKNACLMQKNTLIEDSAWFDASDKSLVSLAEIPYVRHSKNLDTNINHNQRYTALVDTLSDQQQHYSARLVISSSSNEPSAHKSFSFHIGTKSHPLNMTYAALLLAMKRTELISIKRTYPGVFITEFIIAFANLLDIAVDESMLLYNSKQALNKKQNETRFDDLHVNELAAFEYPILCNIYQCIQDSHGLSTTIQKVFGVTDSYNITTLDDQHLYREGIFANENFESRIKVLNELKKTFTEKELNQTLFVKNTSRTISLIPLQQNMTVEFIP